MHILAIIPARGGSRGIPKKNIVPLLGKPLIVWSIEAALGSKHIDRVVVSSDDKQILRTADDIDKALELFFVKKADAVISVYALDKKYLKSFIAGKNGFLLSAFNNRFSFANRQDLPDVFMPNGAIFAIKTEIGRAHV